MKTSKYLLCLFVCIALITLIADQAKAVLDWPVITIDENGNGDDLGTPLQTYFMASTEPAGPATLAYYLGYSYTPGDLILTDPETGLTSDVLRFGAGDDYGYLFFYSEIGNGNTDLADVGLPTVFQSNTFTLEEQVDEGGYYDGHLPYRPDLGQPGKDYVGYSTNITYNIAVDVPEPSTITLLLTLLCIVILGLGGFKLIRRKKSYDAGMRIATTQTRSMGHQ